jgi:hypothetical protein
VESDDVNGNSGSKDEKEALAAVREAHNKVQQMDVAKLLSELQKLVVRMEQQRCLTVQDVAWDLRADCEDEVERVAVQRLGFLFVAYKPRIWWFEIFEMIRKLIMASALVFVWEGSPSQVAAGFVVTLAALVATLLLNPFVNQKLGSMHVFSLIVQAITLLSGLMLITQRFQEILGEDDQQEQNVLAIILVSLHVFVVFAPVIHLFWFSSVEVGSLLVSVGPLKRLLASGTERMPEARRRLSGKSSALGFQFDSVFSAFSAESAMDGDDTVVMAAVLPTWDAEEFQEAISADAGVASRTSGAKVPTWDTEEFQEAISADAGVASRTSGAVVPTLDTEEFHPAISADAGVASRVGSASVRNSAQPGVFSFVRLGSSTSALSNSSEQSEITGSDIVMLEKAPTGSDGPRTLAQVASEYPLTKALGQRRRCSTVDEDVTKDGWMLHQQHHSVHFSSDAPPALYKITRSPHSAGGSPSSKTWDGVHDIEWKMSGNTVQPMDVGIEHANLKANQATCKASESDRADDGSHMQPSSAPQEASQDELHGERMPDTYVPRAAFQLRRNSTNMSAECLQTNLNFEQEAGACDVSDQGDPDSHNISSASVLGRIAALAAPPRGARTQDRARVLSTDCSQDSASLTPFSAAGISLSMDGPQLRSWMLSTTITSPRTSATDVTSPQMSVDDRR